MTTPSEDTAPHSPVKRYDWERIIRRAPIDSTSKLIALTMSTYGDANGTSIFPGALRLSAVTGLNERTVRRGLTKLREGGYVVRTVEQDWKSRVLKGKADVYELSVPPDFLDRPGTLATREVNAEDGSPAYEQSP